MTSILPTTQRAVKWYPPAYDIREEEVPVPRLEHEDDAIVRIKLAGLCGSDLHVYRGHEDVEEPCVMGHEFVGEVVALGSSFGSSTAGRPPLYSTLKIGDMVLAPFTTSCGECYFCRIGFTCRCVHSTLFGIPTLPGGQQQYIRVPKAGGTLYALSGPTMSGIKESALLLLGDILPTGAFAAAQALRHPKLAAVVSGEPFASTLAMEDVEVAPMTDAERRLTIAVVGLGPVGLCAAVSLLHLLEHRHGHLQFTIIAVDLLPTRREKMQAIYNSLPPSARGNGKLYVASPEEALTIALENSNNRGCNAVLEVVGNNSAISLAYKLVQPFGVISSVGVHQAPPLPFTGREMYNKNVSLEFGRCPVRAMFPLALEVLRARQDVFGSVGGETSLIERVVPMKEAKHWYEEFDKGRCGKVVFDPWV